MPFQPGSSLFSSFRNPVHKINFKFVFISVMISGHTFFLNTIKTEANSRKFCASNFCQIFFTTNQFRDMHPFKNISTPKKK